MFKYSVNDVIDLVKHHFLAGQHAQLDHLLTEALSHYNNDQNLLFWLCQFYSQTHRFADLVSLFEHSEKPIPNSCIGLYIHALRVLKRHNEAIQLLENSNSLPQEIALLLALLCKEVGEPDAAITQLLTLINKQPDLTQAYWQLCQLNNSLTSQHIRQLEQLVRSQQLSANNLAYACYTLATVYDQQSDYIKAFSYYQQGASAKLKTFAHFNIDKELQELTDLSYAFNKPLKARGNPSYISQPVFILGMPRSGTILVEQILASHTSVTGADELSDLVLATQQVLTQVKPKQVYPFWADNLSDENYSQIAEQYLKLTQSFQTTAYFTDKMPLNFKAIGIIKRAFPNAKIIH